MRTILSILLALILSLQVMGDLAPSIEAVPVVSAQTVEAETRPETEALPRSEPRPEPQEGKSTAWEDMEYVHYDPEAFYTRTDELTALADQTDEAAVIELYDSLYDEYAAAVTYDSIAYIRYSDDLTDDYWTEESTYCDTLTVQMGDAISTACYHVTQGPCADAFADHVGQDVADAFAEYVPMTDRELEIVTRESELVAQYYERMTVAEDVTYSYLGETWTFDKLAGFPGSNLASRDYDGYLEVYYGLHKAMNDMVGSIFLELVQLRTELAQINGYDTYTDYAYELVYGRDYTAEDAQILCDGVKELAADMDVLDSSMLWYSYEDPTPVMDEAALVDTLGQYAETLHPALCEAWQAWSENGLYRFNSAASAMSGAYTTSLPRYDSAFIYVNMVGDCYDFSTLSHEFGHFTDAWYNQCPNLLVYSGSLDLMETHSQGLEALYTQYYDEIYDQGGDIARFITVGNLLNSVVSGCVYDEFQRRVYADPTMTLDQINELFAAVRAEYGAYEPMDVDYTWVQVLHNFEVPLYYISYATSALAALQIWDISQADLQAGVDAYMAVLEQGAYEKGYFEVLSDCGLRLFTEDGMVMDVCRPVIDYLEALEASQW